MLGRQYEGNTKGNLNALSGWPSWLWGSRKPKGVREVINRIKPAKDGVGAEGKAGTMSVPFS